MTWGAANAEWSHLLRTVSGRPKRSKNQLSTAMSVSGVCGRVNRQFLWAVSGSAVKAWKHPNVRQVQKAAEPLSLGGKVCRCISACGSWRYHLGAYGSGCGWRELGAEGAMPGRCCSPESCPGQDSGEKGCLCPSQTHSAHFQVWVGGEHQVISHSRSVRKAGGGAQVFWELWAGLGWADLA